MKYKYLGIVLKAGCTPQPSTFTDNRTCRERNPDCKYDCNSKIVCNRCGKEKRTLIGLKFIDTGLVMNICNECEEKIKNEVDYGR